MRIVTSGYFNPLHVGHLDLIREAKKLGHLTVIVNNDKQVKVKGSFPFMNEVERVEIIKALRDVDEVVLSFDTDGTILRTLKSLEFDVFAKGGDSVEANTPEVSYCMSLGKKIIFNVGGGKRQSSSTLIKKSNG